MNYIVFDLEFNQGYNFEDEPKNIINPKCPFEIIQIGAVKLDDNFEDNWYSRYISKTRNIY